MDLAFYNFLFLFGEFEQKIFTTDKKIPELSKTVKRRRTMKKIVRLKYCFYSKDLQFMKYFIQICYWLTFVAHGTLQTGINKLTMTPIMTKIF